MARFWVCFCSFVILFGFMFVRSGSRQFGLLCSSLWYLVRIKYWLRPVLRCRLHNAWVLSIISALSPH